MASPGLGAGADPGVRPGRRAERRRATGVALRRAAFALIAEHGYDATGTEDIARAAGVSPRTFFNYFPTKEALLLLPEQPLADVVSACIGSRPAGEDPAKSLAAAAMEVFRLLEALAVGEQRELTVASVRLMLSDPSCRRILEGRREVAERAMWHALIGRGVSPDDVAARATVAAVAAASFVALAVWAERGGADQLTALLAQCLLGLPEPVRLAVGIVATAPVPVGDGGVPPGM